MTNRVKALLTTLVAALVFGAVTTVPALAASEFVWKIKGTVLEVAKVEKLTFKQKENFVLETKVLGMPIKAECEQAISLGEIEGGAMAGKPGRFSGVAEFTKCKLIEAPKGCTIVTVGSITLSGEITEVVLPAGLVGHNSVMARVIGEPKISLTGEGCTFSTVIKGAVAPTVMPDKTEQVELKWEFVGVSRVKEFGGLEAGVELKAFGSPLTVSGVSLANTPAKSKWGVF